MNLTEAAVIIAALPWAVRGAEIWAADRKDRRAKQVEYARQLEQAKEASR